MNNNIVSRIASIVFALAFVPFGINHLKAGAAMAPYVPIPGGAFWVYLTGVCFLLAAVALILNVKARLAGYLLGTMMLIIAISVHLVAYLKDTADPGMHFPQFLKDTALAAAAFFIGSVSKK